MRVCMAVSCLFLALTAPALAHGKPEGYRVAVQGTVTAVSRGTLRVQSANGSVSVNLTSATRVFRMVDGTLADVPVNAWVDAHLVQGNTVDFIQVDGTAKPKPLHLQSAGHRRGPSRGRPGPHHSQEASPAHVSGQVVAITANTITVRDARGRDTTYSIGDSVIVTKIMGGTMADLSVGETVRVIRGPNANALSVTILSA